jgi:hypothetical protein
MRQHIHFADMSFVMKLGEKFKFSNSNFISKNFPENFVRWEFNYLKGNPFESTSVPFSCIDLFYLSRLLKF